MNVVITGASRGIGFALAKDFVAAGHAVFAIARSSDRLELLKEAVNEETAAENLHILPFDLQSGNIAGNLLPEIKSVLGSIDVLINNAGLLISKPFRELSDRDFDQIFEVNVKSVFRLVRDLLPLFEGGSHIVNISSMGGYQGSAKFPGLSLYSAAKGALGVLSECLAEELKDQQIKVNALAIGAVQTEMLSQAFPGYEAPLQPEEMARFIRDFALTGHLFFNGKILPVSLSTP